MLSARTLTTCAVAGAGQGSVGGRQAAGGVREPSGIRALLLPAMAAHRWQTTTASPTIHSKPTAHLEAVLEGQRPREHQGRVLAQAQPRARAGRRHRARVRRAQALHRRQPRHKQGGLRAARGRCGGGWGRWVRGAPAARLARHLAVQCGCRISLGRRLLHPPGCTPCCPGPPWAPRCTASAGRSPAPVESRGGCKRAGRQGRQVEGRRWGCGGLQRRSTMPSATPRRRPPHLLRLLQHLLHRRQLGRLLRLCQGRGRGELACLHRPSKPAVACRSRPATLIRPLPP